MTAPLVGVSAGDLGAGHLINWRVRVRYLDEVVDGKLTSVTHGSSGTALTLLTPARVRTLHVTHGQRILFMRPLEPGELS
jgi:hypothetical protein